MAERIDRDAAQKWSRERIQEELADLRRLIEDQERVCREDSERLEEDAAAHGIRPDYSQINFMREAIYDWESDITFLKTLL